MKIKFLFVSLIVTTSVYGQRVYTPVIEPGACPVKVDSTFKTRCGYLVVPENRTKKSSRNIKLPFVWVESKNPNKRKDPFLYTAGGPGGSSLGWAVGTSRRNDLIADRDLIAFEQRGTRFALPNLNEKELADAVKDSYRRNLNKDSMVIVGVKRMKERFESEGVDLAGYNTDESVSDILDLLKVLKIDSVNLFGISYNGGLMPAVVQRDPSRIRSMVLDSPLPTFIAIDQDEPANFNEALRILSTYCAADSLDKQRYGNLKGDFEKYFNSIAGKTFTTRYAERGKTDTMTIEYTRAELLGVIVGTMGYSGGVSRVPYIITEMIRGNHAPFIKDAIDAVFRDNVPSGMRISVYCADQAAYHDENVIREIYKVYPWMEGYHINDVYKDMCDCWNVPPVKRSTKQPFYSNVPVLLADGAMDPACRPQYIDQFHHYFPNSQRLLAPKKSHVVLGSAEGTQLMRDFLNAPMAVVEPKSSEYVRY